MNNIRNRIVGLYKLNGSRSQLQQTMSHSNDTRSEGEKAESKRLAEFRKKLRETTPITDLGEQTAAAKEDPLPPFPDNTNPTTGEVGGPRGPEPTRYGDWERKGRVTDF